MKQFLPALFTLLSITTLFAQTKINGIVKDNHGKPVAGASITIKDSYDGGVSDSIGRFVFKCYDKGTQTIIVKNIGYKTVQQPVALTGEALTLNFTLKEEINELKAVTVTAGSFEAGDKKRAATVLSSLDVVTTGGANADITNAIKTLPGAQQVGEQEGLFVRGGTGYETKQFIDGTLVNNPYNASVPDIASRGRFSPFLFKGTVFSTGGYSALYGQALSSAVILETIDLPDQSQASASISTVFVGAGLQELAKNKKSSWGINYGYTNLALYFAIVPQTPDYFHMPEFHTADANFRIKTKGGMIKYYTTYAASNIGIRRPDIESDTLKDAYGIINYNWYNNLSWREFLGHGWKMNLGSSFSTNKDLITQQIQNHQNQHTNTGFVYIDSNNRAINNRQDLAQIRAVFDKKLSGISVIRFGGEYWYANSPRIINSAQYQLKDNFAALFSEADLYLTNDIAAKLGVRAEHSSQVGKFNFAPRLSVAYKTGEHSQMSAVYGQFYQKPENTYYYYGNINLGYVKASHYLLNYIRNTATQTFRVEAFYKKYQSLVETPPTYLYNNNGSGYAQGAELFWRDKKTIKGVDYWFSYSYLDTKRMFDRYPTQLAPTFAATHTASLVLKKFFPKFSTGINGTYSFATGRPYYYFQQIGNKYTIGDEGKTKDYNTFGISVNYLTKIKSSFAVFVASVTNVFDSKNIYGYNYNHDGSVKAAIMPPAPRFFFIGVFLSWGVDRRDDAINNNL
ncbi:TonB-dependent receptor [Parasediminibacterium sp. JCM 36343]|uniref:TonB-dependent receptor n=1 Tax=Parasediminibacterium sp. JCM 36343 TaxID=3374279 RepID=UPI00397C6C94